MRAVWSFWSKPYLAAKGFRWREDVHHLLAWGLSLLLAQRHYPETFLVTDTPGKTLLIDRLGLSFTHVSTELDRFRNVDAAWWTLGKLAAYTLQDRPFVHLDTDVFLWKPLPAHLENAPVFSQCPEEHPLDEWCGPDGIERAFERHGLALPAEWEWARSRYLNHFREENCGIVGGTRADFFRYYAGIAMDLVLNPKHSPAWSSFRERAGYNYVIEQFLLASCLDFHRFHPDSPFRGIRAQHLFATAGQAFGDQQAAARLGFTHLTGAAKLNALMMQRLEQRVQREDLAFYRRAVRLSQNRKLLAGVGA